MSAAEIIESLESLSEQDLRRVTKRILQIEQDSAAVRESSLAADAAFQILDGLEAEDAKS